MLIIFDIYWTISTSISDTRMWGRDINEHDIFSFSQFLPFFFLSLMVVTHKRTYIDNMFM